MAEAAPLSFGLRGQTFRVGDCVALLPPPGSEEPYVARIVAARTGQQLSYGAYDAHGGAGVGAFGAPLASSGGTAAFGASPESLGLGALVSPTGVTEVQVRWFYRPEETMCGRRPYHGERELFASDHLDWQPIRAINYRCDVHSLKAWLALGRKPEIDYFSRYEYISAKGIFKPGLVPVYCVCGLPYNPDFFMVECCRCLEWYHPQCVGETAESSRRRAWRCPKCCQP